MKIPDKSREELELELYTAKSCLEMILSYIESQERLGVAKGDCRMALLTHIKKFALQGLGKTLKGRQS